jgi:hypothetical protein
VNRKSGSFRVSLLRRFLVDCGIRDIENRVELDGVEFDGKVDELLDVGMPCEHAPYQGNEADQDFLIDTIGAEGTLTPHRCGNRCFRRLVGCERRYGNRTRSFAGWMIQEEHDWLESQVEKIYYHKRPAIEEHNMSANKGMLAIWRRRRQPPFKIDGNNMDPSS